MSMIKYLEKGAASLGYPELVIWAEVMLYDGHNLT